MAESRSDSRLLPCSNTLAIDVLPLDAAVVTANRAAEPQLGVGRLVFNADHLQENRMQSDMTKTADRPVEAQETNRLISSEKVDGTAVYNGKGQHLGAVHHLMIDKFSGHVEYAVMSFGGFLGIGESYHPLP